MQSNNLIDVLENDEANSFITQHINDRLSNISLRFAGKTSFNITVCLQLMSVYKKARKKLPTFWERRLALDQRSYEQCTSEAVARYKANFISGDSLLDITGGIGVDSLFLAPGFKSVIAVERNEELHRLAAYNITKLGLANVARKLGDGQLFISADFDWIYIDPDRRVSDSRSVVLSALEPNIINLMPTLSKYAKRVYVKLSPLFDLAEVWRKFNNVDCIHVIAEGGEIKEVGVVLDMKLRSNNVVVILKDVSSGFLKKIHLADCELISEYGEYDVSFSFLMVPIALVSKSSSTSLFLKDIDVSKHKIFNLFFSKSSEVEGFRCFKILEHTTLNTKVIKNALKKHHVSQINIVIKGLSDEVGVWHKKIGTRDGGKYYLFLLKSERSSAFFVKLIS